MPCGDGFCKTHKGQRSVRLVLAIAILLPAGCAFRPIESDLTGEYALTDASRRLYVDGLRGVTPLLTLRADGDFEAIGVPAELFGGKPSDGILFAHGTWRLETSGKVHVTVSTLDGERFDYGRQFTVRGSRSRSVLRAYRGDPDQMETIDFEKR